MLVLSRKVGEEIFIGDDIVVVVKEITFNKRVRIGIQAPKDVKIMREEVLKDDEEKG